MGGDFPSSGHRSGLIIELRDIFDVGEIFALGSEQGVNICREQNELIDLRTVVTMKEASESLFDTHAPTGTPAWQEDKVTQNP